MGFEFKAVGTSPRGFPLPLGESLTSLDAVRVAQLNLLDEVLDETGDRASGMTRWQVVAHVAKY